MEKDIILGDKGTTIIQDKKYFFKRNDAYVEILVEKIADLFGLKHAHYIPITLNDKNYYLSEDLNYKGDFKTADDIGIDTNHIKDIRDSILTIFPKDFDHLMDDVMKMYFMDLMILNIDRNTSNWGFLTKDNHTELYVLDNDLSFIWYNSCMTSCSNFNRKQDSYIEVMNIFDTFPNEYLNMFMEMYNTLDYETLERLIKETEKDIGKELPNKNNYLSRFASFRRHMEYAKEGRHLELIKTEN